MAEYTYTFSTSSISYLSSSIAPFAVLFNTGSNKMYLDKVVIVNKPGAATTGLHQIWEAYRCIDTGSAYSSSFSLITHDTTNPAPPVVVYSKPAGVTITGSVLFAYNQSTDEAAQNIVMPMYENYGTGYNKRITLNQNEGILFRVGNRLNNGLMTFVPYITINISE